MGRGLWERGPQAVLDSSRGLPRVEGGASPFPQLCVPGRKNQAVRVQEMMRLSDLKNGP